MAGSINAQLAPITRVNLPTQSVPPAPPPTTSTAGKVAIGAAAVGGGATLTLLIVSAATGWGVGKVLDKAWDKLRGK